jgi:A/G-specific adenine glycosylase
MQELPTIAALAKATPARIHKLWEGLGYYTRVRNLQRAAQQICEEHQGHFPSAFEAILGLPGIGRYTAGAIASIAFNQPAPILDGNVIRVLTRLHGIDTDPREKKTNARLWELAGGLVAQASLLRYHALPCSSLNQSLMELGALVCTPRSPDCVACPIARHCIALRDGRVAELPHPKQRAATTARRFIAFIIEHKGRFLVQQRPDAQVNAHLWEFPNSEASRDCSAEEVARRHFGMKTARAEKLCIVKHSITRYRMTTEAWRLILKNPPPHSYGVWRTPAQIRSQPFTTAHRKIANRLMSGFPE